MIKVNEIKLIDGKRVSSQEEIGTQIDDLRNLSEKAIRYAQELESISRGIATDDRLEKTQSEFLAAVQFAMIYESEEE